MRNIQLLDENTINQIAAGEVVDRPASIVKELMENAIDAGADSISVEIKDGGISLIRITDNGCGIRKEDIRAAFLRHSTSKIRSAKDLICVSSLGFRGEALSSIAAVCQVELITKSADEITACRYRIDGGKEISFDEVGAPDGTTIIARNIFYNTPARKKFLKSGASEAGYISDIVEKIALAAPDVSIHFVNNSKTILHTAGNSDLHNIIYNIYGRDIAANLIEVNCENQFMKINGYIGKPVITKGNRSFENYNINGRYIKSAVISKAIEEAYKPYMMQHKHPFTALNFTIDSHLLDVNVHPAKMEVRFNNSEEIYNEVFRFISDNLKHREYIPDAVIGKEEKTDFRPPLSEAAIHAPEPFEVNRIKETVSYTKDLRPAPLEKESVAETMNLFDTNVLRPEARHTHKIIGQVFGTYWIIEREEKMFIIDQHAAHEKVLYERTMARIKESKIIAQNLNPPIIVTLSMNEEETLRRYMSYFNMLGFEIENFGGREYAVRAVPYHLVSVNNGELFMDILDNLTDGVIQNNPDLIVEKVASVSCKAAVKGNTAMSVYEAQALIDELLTLDNPYQCPHGRPTIISISKYEMEKKFKRII